MTRFLLSITLTLSGLIGLAQPTTSGPPVAGPYVPILIENPTDEKAVVELVSLDGSAYQRLELEAEKAWTLNVGGIHGYFVVRILQPSGIRTEKYHRP